MIPLAPKKNDFLIPNEWDFWKPKTKLSVSEWADQNIYLDPTSKRPGPWDTSYTPFLKEYLDSFGLDHVRMIICQAGSQQGKSIAFLIMICYCIAQTPSDLLLVLPTEKDLKYSINRLKHLINASPNLKKHKTWRKDSLNYQSFTLDNMNIYFGTANSAASLAQKSLPYVFLDEVRLYPTTLQNETGAFRQAAERTKTFHDSYKIVGVSTPSVAGSEIDKALDRTDNRKYFMPCPFCNEWQLFHIDRMTWPEKGRASITDILKDHLGFYSCKKCEKAIKDSDKENMVKDGIWVPEDCKIKLNGKIEGNTEDPFRGYQMNSLLTPWVSFSRYIADYLRSIKNNDPSAYQGFINNMDGMPYAPTIQNVTHKKLESKKKINWNRGYLPPFIKIITAGLDTQQDHWFYIIRGWGAGERSHLIDEGRIEGGFEELTARILDSWYVGEDNNKPMNVTLACIDAGGSRYYEILEACKQLGPRIRPVIGKYNIRSLIQATTVDFHPTTGQKIQSSEVKVWNLLVSAFKDKLLAFWEAKEGSPGEWSLHNDVSYYYLKQVTAEHKILERDKKGNTREMWRKRTPNIQNHYLDCEIYAMAAAEMLPQIRAMRADGNIVFNEPSKVGVQKNKPVNLNKDPSRERQAASWLDKTFRPRTMYDGSRGRSGYKNTGGWSLR